MTSIDERLETGADSLRESLSGHHGPGIDGIARASRRQRQRRRTTVGVAAIVVCLGLVAVLSGPSDDRDLDVAARDRGARDRAIDACRASFSSHVDREADTALASEGIDLRGIDAEGMAVASVLSDDGEFSSVVLTDPAITYRCIGDRRGAQSSLSYLEQVRFTSANDLWIEDVVIFGSDPVLLAGRVGESVIAIEATLADLGPTEFFIDDGRFLMVAPPYEAADFVPLDDLRLTWSMADGTTRSGDALMLLDSSIPDRDDERARQNAIDVCEAQLIDQVESADSDSEPGRLGLSPDGSPDQWFQIQTFRGFGRLVPVVFERPDAFGICLATDTVLESEIVIASPFFLPESASDVVVFSARLETETDTTPPAMVPLIVGRAGFDVANVDLVVGDKTLLPGVLDNRWFVITGGLPTGADLSNAQLEVTLRDGMTRRIALAEVTEPRG